MIVSIHDATADSLPGLIRIIEKLRQSGIRNADLLVVCGDHWTPQRIDQLRRLSDNGIALQGHGWTHRAGRIRSLGHRLHSWCVSRNVAEHLSKSEDEIAEIIERSYAWFHRHRLPAPTLYVPPAWAMGAVSRKRLRQLPYRFFETLNGIYDSELDRFHRMSLMGFEADTWFRAMFLRLFNRVNRWRSKRMGRVIRLAIHPEDLELRLAAELQSTIENPGDSRRGGVDCIFGVGNRRGRPPQNSREPLGLAKAKHSVST